MGTAKTQDRKQKPKWIIRAPHNTQAYFIMARSTAQDQRLSWAARGMLTYLLSKPDDWRINIKDLQQGCGRDKVYNLLDELIEYRYVVRSKGQTVDYYVYELPLPENTEVEIGLPEIPDQENQDAYIIQNKEQNTDNTSVQQSANASAAPSPNSVPDSKPPITIAPKKPAINQVLKDEIAIHVQGIAPTEGTAVTGLLANSAAGVHKRHTKKSALTADDYTDVARSIPDFALWYRGKYPGIDLPQNPGKFENHYQQFVSQTTNSKRASPIEQQAAEFGLSLDDMVKPIGKASAA